MESPDTHQNANFHKLEKQKSCKSPQVLSQLQFSPNAFFQEIFHNESTHTELFNFLIAHWRKYVPHCYRNGDTPGELSYEIDPQYFLIGPLEAYLCKSLDNINVLKNLSSLDNTSRICGKIFKLEEKAYFCQDCSYDITRVLCNDCFRNSKHRDHRYKILKTEGNGYCDCGDIDAWKSHPHCDNHAPTESSTNQDENNPDLVINKLPTDLIDRFTKLIKCVLFYLVEILSIEDEIQGTQDLSLKFKVFEETGEYIVFMQKNDSMILDVDLDNVIMNLLHVDVVEARQFANVFRKQGRCPVKVGGRKECELIKNLLTNRKTSKIISKLTVISQNLASHQYFAERLLSWLQSLGKYSKCLSNLSCKLLFSDTTQIERPNSPIILSLLKHNLHVWQQARENMHLLVVNTVLMNPYWKRKFAILYARNYKDFVKDYLINRNFTTLTTLNLTVQLFPVSSLTKLLLEECSLFEVIIDTLIDTTRMDIEDMLFLTGTSEKTPQYILSKLILIDLSYLLTNVPKEWSNQMRQNFLRGLRLFLVFLQKLQDINAVSRYSKNHIEYEPEWEKSYFFLSRLQKPLSLLIDWCASDKEIFSESIKCLLNETFLTMIMPDVNSFRNFTGYRTIEYDVLSEKVSLHPHYSRFVCICIAQLSRFNKSETTSGRDIRQYFREFVGLELSDDLVLAVVEPSIRANVLYSQSNCGVWKKNGVSLLNQVYLYHNIMFRNEFLDRDILSLQLAAALLQPNLFLVNLLNRFDLLEYLINPDLELPEETEEIDPSYLKKLSEYFLELLIFIYCERYETYLSVIEPNEKLEREVIHFLCSVEPMAFSFLSTKIYRDLEHYTNDFDLTNVLNKVANVKNSDCKSLKSIYELKQQYIHLYSPYFYHYSTNEKSQADEKLIKLKKSNPDYFIKPSNTLPVWQPAFKNIRHLLDSDIFIKIVHCVLTRVIRGDTNGENKLLKILYLLGLALNEDFNDLNEFKTTKMFAFNFVEKCERLFPETYGLKKLLESVTTMPYMLSEAYKSSAEWTLNYYMKLTELKKNKSDLTNFTISSFVTSTTQSSIEAEEKQRLKLKAERRRQMLLSKFERKQQTFADSITQGKDIKAKTSDNNLIPFKCDIQQMRCFGKHRNINECQKNGLVTPELCILCQQEENVDEDSNSSPIIQLCYIQNSRVLCKDRSKPVKANTLNNSFFKHISELQGINTTTCGHTMHLDCWHKYIDSIKLHNTILNKHLEENFCPLCETITNCVISISSDEFITQSPCTPYQIKFNDWFNAIKNKYSSKLKNLFEENINDQDHCFTLDINNNILTDKPNKSLSLVNEFTTNSAKRTSYTTANKLNLYACIWSNCSYTIQVIEHMLRGEKRGHFLDITDKQATLISSLIKHSAAYTCLTKADTILESITSDLLSQFFSTSDEIHLFEIDMFHLLVSLNFSRIGYFFDRDNEENVFKFILQAHCVQVLVNSLAEGSVDCQSVDECEEDNIFFVTNETLWSLIKALSHENHLLRMVDNCDFLKIKSILRQSLTQFLQCSAIYFCNLYGITKKFCEVESVNNDNNSRLINLLKFFGLDEGNLNECLNVNSETVKFLVKRMVKGLPKSSSSFSKINQNSNGSNQFVPLPDDYLDLISMCTTLNSSEYSNVMCLVCGEILKKETHILDEKIVGACTAHTHKCCLNNGVFLKIDECKVLMLQIKFTSSGKMCEVTGCYVSAPYLDDYGETDQDFLKGNPLHLCKANYQRLYNDWISHSIPERIFSHNCYRINNIDMSSV